MAEWCGPCKAMAPTFEKISKMDEYKDISFKEIDVDNDDDELSVKYGVRGIPTIIAIDDEGNSLGKSVGLVSEKQLLELINEILSK